jgi:hypothetical protein
MSAAVEYPPVEVVNASGTRLRLVRIAALVGVLAASALIELYIRTSFRTLTSGDFWWHLRTGMWVLENHAVPRTGIYSQNAQTPWTATSWLFDLVTAIGYRIIDLRVAPILLSLGKLLLGIAVFVLAGGTGGKFWPAIGLVILAEYILSGLPPGPAYAAIVCFAITLSVLQEARRSNEVLRVLWLVPVFLLWANLDNDFVYGVAALWLFLTSRAIDGIAAGKGVFREPSHTVGKAFLAVSVCTLATLCTPYFFRVYSVFFTSFVSPANRFLGDYHAIAFRDPRDYLMLLLTMTAFLSLGMRRSRDPFQISLMVLTSAWAFHLHTYAWMVLLASIAVIGNAMRTHQRLETLPQPKGRWREAVIAGVMAAVVVLAGAAFLPRTHGATLAEMKESYPVSAADFIRASGLQQPLFNSKAWGGFLMWYLPEYPVAIDGRVPLYNDEANIRYARFMRSDFSYREYAPVNQARTILLERNSPMAQVLSGVAGFRVAYSDDVAIVLLHEEARP